MARHSPPPLSARRLLHGNDAPVTSSWRHRRRQVRTLDPHKADLFYVPTMSYYGPASNVGTDAPKVPRCAKMRPDAPRGMMRTRCAARISTTPLWHAAPRRVARRSSSPSHISVRAPATPSSGTDTAVRTRHSYCVHVAPRVHVPQAATTSFSPPLIRAR